MWPFNRKPEPQKSQGPVEFATAQFLKLRNYHDERMQHFERIGNDAHALMIQHERAFLAAKQALEAIEKPASFDMAIAEFEKELETFDASTVTHTEDMAAATIKAPHIHAGTIETVSAMIDPAIRDRPLEGSEDHGDDYVSRLPKPRARGNRKEPKHVQD